MGKRKTIWIIDHYSSEPQYGGISRQYDFAKELDKRGYNVIIFASGFSHYTHTYISDDELYITKPFKHVRYVYVKTHSYEENNGKDRAINMVSFMTQVLRYYKNVAKHYGKPDVVEGASVHPLAWIAAYRIARKYKTRFVAEVRDFWPQVWIDSGEKRATDPMCLFFRAVEKFTYKHADHIIYSPYHGDRYLCGEMHVPKDKVTMIGQVMDCERFDRNRERLDLLPNDVQEFISTGFVCCFTGYYMHYNGVFTILDAKKKLQDTNLPVKMIFVGNGEEETEMRDYIKRNELTDVMISERIDREAVPALISHCDVCISQIGHRNRPDVYRYGVSLLKMNEYMYSGSLILFGFRYLDNEVSESGAGIQYEPYNSDDLAEKINQIYGMDKEKRAEYGQRGRNYYKRTHSVKALSDVLLTALF